MFKLKITDELTMKINYSDKIFMLIGSTVTPRPSHHVLPQNWYIYWGHQFWDPKTKKPTL